MSVPPSDAVKEKVGELYLPTLVQVAVDGSARDSVAQIQVRRHVSSVDPGCIVARCGRSSVNQRTVVPLTNPDVAAGMRGGQRDP